MQPADNVKFRRALGDAFRRARPDFLLAEGIGARRVSIAAKGAQAAMRHAYVRRIDVPVDVVIADVAVQLLAHPVRKPADGHQVVRFVKPQAFFGIEPRAGQYFFGDGLEPRVSDL